jgi:hypothetical protein
MGTSLVEEGGAEIPIVGAGQHSKESDGEDGAPAKQRLFGGKEMTIVSTAMPWRRD